ncbi:MAG: Hsp20/alpha crystallin family protein [Patescibacteria group bacterium]|nr:Hsp20/alpha crystallin family protein [Patescibacteria group bacterium]
MANFFKKLAGVNNESIDVDVNNEQKETNNKSVTDKTDEEWINNNYEEGQLSVDVYQTANNLMVQSTIAGVKPEDIDISINNDMLTIRGKRKMDATVKEEDYLYQECYWGNFSRSIILPVEVKAEEIEASLDNGVLTITLPKAKSARQISIKVREK